LFFFVSGASGSARGWKTKYKGFGVWCLALWGNSLKFFTTGSWLLAHSMAFTVAYGISPLRFDFLYSWCASHVFLPRRRYIDHRRYRPILHYDRSHSYLKSLLCHTNYGPDCALCWDDIKMNLAVHKLVTACSYYADAAFTGQRVTTSPSNLFGSSLYL
jgi:hypothetical protein